MTLPSETLPSESALHFAPGDAVVPARPPMPETTGPGQGAEAVIFIPGFNSTEQDAIRDRYLIPGLAGYPYADPEDPAVTIEPEDPAPVKGVAAPRRLTVKVPAAAGGGTGTAGGTKQVDVYEAFWGDLVGSLSQEPLDQRLRDATTLLGFWITTPAWREKRLFLGFVSTLLMMMLWYVSTAVALIAAVSRDPKQLGLFTPLRPAAQGIKDWLNTHPGLLGAWATGELHALVDQAGRVPGWGIWGVLGVLFVVLHIAAAVDVADFARRYLQDCAIAGGGPLQRKVHARLGGVLAAVCGSGRYERVTVVSHSLGVLVGTELMADCPATECPVALRYLSLGGSLSFLALRSPRIGDFARECARKVPRWTEFNSPSDWIGSDRPVLPDSGGFRTRMIPLPGSLLRRLSGKTHSDYFRRDEVLADILGLGAEE
ncbi:MAG: hypothetical protein M3Y28_07060 [Armatimonadota bacterium]|nr:hypothetical protein [Armatimonadota bacterium]